VLPKKKRKKNKTQDTKKPVDKNEKPGVIPETIELGPEVKAIGNTLRAWLESPEGKAKMEEVKAAVKFLQDNIKTQSKVPWDVLLKKVDI
jgi:hypothetical protein